MAFWPFGYTEATDVDEDNDFSGGGGLLRAGKRQRKWKFKTIREWLESTAEFLSLIAYRDRVKTKVLWTGPLSVVATPTSLDGAEKFSDWDQIRIYANLSSDLDTGNNLYTFEFSLVSARSLFRIADDTGLLKFSRLSDTTFELSTKTVGAGNISLIEGISL